MNYFATLKQVVGAGCKVIRAVDELHPHTRAGHLVGQPDIPIGDFVGCMQNGWEWIFPCASILQPKFHECLESQDPKVVVVQDSYVDPFGKEKVSADLFLLLEDSLVQIDPWSANYSICDIRGRNAWWDSIYSCLPDAICEVYYGRLDGMCMTGDMSFARTSAYGLPSKLVTSQVFEDVVAGRDRGRIRELRKSLEAVLDGETISSSRDVFRDFRFILDSRLVNGDALFFQHGSKRKRVFHFVGNDWLNFRVIDDPARLFDDYMSNVLMFKEGRFDFLPYGTPVRR